MKLDKTLELIIKEFNSKLSPAIELDEAAELTLDYLIDHDFVDLSNDDTGDQYEWLNNQVWECIEKVTK
jgi:hypothetical protein